MLALGLGSRVKVDDHAVRRPFTLVEVEPLLQLLKLLRVRVKARVRVRMKSRTCARACVRVVRACCACVRAAGSRSRAIYQAIYQAIYTAIYPAIHQAIYLQQVAEVESRREEHILHRLGLSPPGLGVSVRLWLEGL